MEQLLEEYRNHTLLPEDFWKTRKEKQLEAQRNVIAFLANKKIAEADEFLKLMVQQTGKVIKKGITKIQELEEELKEEKAKPHQGIVAEDTTKIEELKAEVQDILKKSISEKGKINELNQKLSKYERIQKDKINILGDYSDNLKKITNLNLGELKQNAKTPWIFVPNDLIKPILTGKFINSTTQPDQNLPPRLRRYFDAQRFDDTKYIPIKNVGTIYHPDSKKLDVDDLNINLNDLKTEAQKEVNEFYNLINDTQKSIQQLTGKTTPRLAKRKSKPSSTSSSPSGKPQKKTG